MHFYAVPHIPSVGVCNVYFYINTFKIMYFLYSVKTDQCYKSYKLLGSNKNSWDSATNVNKNIDMK